MCLERAGVCLSVVMGERARERPGTGRNGLLLVQMHACPSDNFCFPNEV